jgi:hypothetical protein
MGEQKHVRRPWRRKVLQHAPAQQFSIRLRPLDAVFIERDQEITQIRAIDLLDWHVSGPLGVERPKERLKSNAIYCKLHARTVARLVKRGV